MYKIAFIWQARKCLVKIISANFFDRDFLQMQKNLTDNLFKNGNSVCIGKCNLQNVFVNDIFIAYWLS